VLICRPFYSHFFLTSNMNSAKKLSLLDRVALPSPTFWKKVSAVGKAIGGLGLVLVSAPVALPAAVVTAAGYLVLVGSLTAGLSALTVAPGADAGSNGHADQPAGEAGTR
jgi:ABC-type xylose transport system permease subunit